MLKRAAVILAVAMLTACGPAAAPGPAAPSAAPVPLIPRAALFGDPERERAQISPDGKWLSYLDRREGRRTLVAALVADRVDVRRIAEGAEDYLWSADGAFILYRATVGGAWHAIDLLKTGEDRILIAEPGARALPPSLARPRVVAFTLGADLYEVDIRTGARTPVFRNRDGYGDFLLDAQNRPVVGLKRLPSGDLEITALAGAPKKLLIIPAADAPDARLLGAAPNGASFLMVSTFGRKHAALTRVDLATGAMSPLAQDEAADITAVWQTPSTGELEAYAASPIEQRWSPLNQVAAADLALLKQNLKAIDIVSRSADNMKWIVREETPSLAPRVWLYDRAAKKLERLFSEYPPLEGVAFSQPKPISITGAQDANFDGLLFQPAGGEARTLIVIAPESGALVTGRFNAPVQYFANLGYGVLEAPAGALAQVSRWAIDAKLAAAEKQIALMGERAAFSAIPLQGKFACAVIADSPPFVPAKPEAAKDSILLVRRGMGMKDEKPVYAAQAYFPDETQSFARAENRVAFYALAGAFVSGCLGKEIAPIGADLQNSSLEILNGQALIPTLKAAMAPRESEAGAPP